MQSSDPNATAVPIPIATPVIFTDGDVAQIIRALCVEANPHRLGLLSQVLREWAEVDLVQYTETEAFRASEPTRAARYKRINRSAKELLDAIVEADDLGLIAVEMGRVDATIEMRERREHFRQKLMEQRVFLTILIAAAQSLQTQMKSTRGRPRSIVSYIVLQDIVAVYEWLTERKASRQVDRIEGNETGPLYLFARELWPIVFKSGDDGLSAAMKNWALGRGKFGESSALIANISFRHPSWRVFAR
jgi:hypothetical protein